MIPNINETINETVEKLNYLNMVIKNLIDRDNISSVNIAEADERLAQEIMNYENLIEELKSNLILTITKDITRIHDANFNNQNNFGTALNSLSRIEDTLDLIRKHESGKGPGHLQELIKKAEKLLNEMKAKINKEANEFKNQKKQDELDRYPITEHP